MDFIWNSITDWLKEVLVSGIVSNLSGMFDSTNEQIGQIAGQVGLTPQAWNSGIFNMIQNLSNNVILPLAGAILAVVMTLELIQLITDRNNLNDVDTWMFFKWVFKSAAAVLIVSNTWTIVMGIFDAAQSVVNGAAGVMIGNTSIDISSVVTDLESRLIEMDVGPLLGLWFQSLFVGICTWAITICIFIVIYGRMIEVYLVTSVAPIPMATMANREWGQMGQNYLRTLLALGFQAFLIMVCVAIYSVLVQNISVSTDISTAIWTCMGYTVLLCFCLFKTSSLGFFCQSASGSPPQRPAPALPCRRSCGKATGESQSPCPAKESGGGTPHQQPPVPVASKAGHQAPVCCPESRTQYRGGQHQSCKGSCQKVGTGGNFCCAAPKRVCRRPRYPADSGIPTQRRVLLLHDGGGHRCWNRCRQLCRR